MRVQLLLTCLCDAFFGEVGIASVKVLEHAGCVVEFPENQTCCGQPPFNAGDWEAARQMAAHTSRVFDFEHSYVVAPSSSCAATVRHGYGMMAGKGHERCFELCEFLVNVLGVTKWPLEGNRVGTRRRVALHRACHGRVLGLGNVQERLLSSIPGMHLIPFEQAEQCCGFGGAFSATHGTISSAIGLEKLQNIVSSGAEMIVSGDMGCLVHLKGLVERHEIPLRTAHIAEVLAEAIQ